MHSILAKTPEKLLQKLKQIDISVPGRTKGRKTEHSEKWAIVRFLSTYLNENQLDFPISIVHRDKPDFLMTCNVVNYGIECTEAIPKQYAWAHALLEIYFPNGNLEPDFFKWGTPTRSREEILDILSKSQDELHGEPWFGNSVEKEWAQGMYECITHKTQKFYNDDFEKFEKNYLLIYDNIPQAANNLTKSTNYLNRLLNKYWNNNSRTIFTKILIESKEYIVQLSAKRYFQLTIPH